MLKKTPSVYTCLAKVTTNYRSGKRTLYQQSDGKTQRVVHVSLNSRTITDWKQRSRRTVEAGGGAADLENLSAIISINGNNGAGRSAVWPGGWSRGTEQRTISTRSTPGQRQM